MQWYYASDGQQHGPVAEAELRELVASGKLGAENLVWRDGMGDWLAIGRVPELANALAPEIPSGPPAAPVQSPYQPPAAHPGSPAAGGEIPSYLWQSIVVTLLCCQIFGIVAIVFAARVDGLKSAGDLAGARDASDKAKMWCMWGFISGLVVILLYAIVIIAAES